MWLELQSGKRKQCYVNTRVTHQSLQIQRNAQHTLCTSKQIAHYFWSVLCYNGDKSARYQLFWNWQTIPIVHRETVAQCLKRGKQTNKLSSTGLQREWHSSDKVRKLWFCQSALLSVSPARKQEKRREGWWWDMTMVIAMMVVGGVNVVVWGPHPTADTKPLKNVKVSTWAQTCPLCSSSLSEDEIVKSTRKHQNTERAPKP